MDHQVSLPTSTTTGLSFKVHRQPPELVTPAGPTPRELKLLSDIDDQQGLRFQIPLIFFCRPNLTCNQDPVRTIKKALAETLVYYYPFAGRLRELTNRKLAVDCTGEGVLFIEADAEVTLAQLEEAGDALLPPFPCLEELLFDVEGSSEILNAPLLLFQVTRLKCSGFIFAFRINHTMADGAGMSLFMRSLCELVCGFHAPTIPPVWDRHLLISASDARVTHTHLEYENKTEVDVVATSKDSLVTKSFFFGAGDILAIRKLLPPELNHTSFEALSSFLWRCRTIALNPDPNTEMRLTCIINSRSKLKNLPPGYYGNVFVIPVAIATARDLTEKPLEFALRLIQEVKSSVTDNYVRSVIALMATRGRPMFVMTQNYIISDLRHFGLDKVYFGPWGKPVYGGTAKAGIAVFPGVSFYVPFTNKKGEAGTVVAITLPVEAMERFVKEVDSTLNVSKL